MDRRTFCRARLLGRVYVDILGRDLRSAVLDIQCAVADQVKLPSGKSNCEFRSGRRLPSDLSAHHSCRCSSLPQPIS